MHKKNASNKNKKGKEGKEVLLKNIRENLNQGESIKIRW